MEQEDIMELKKCPFCGGVVELYRNDGRFCVICNPCLEGGFYGLFYSEQEAIDAWNRRAE
jgi:hypothetical protein